MQAMFRKIFTWNTWVLCCLIGLCFFLLAVADEHITVLPGDFHAEASVQKEPIFYVSTTGSDDNPGSQTKPFLTIQHAIKQVPDGATINVMAGTYNETLAIDGKNLTIQGEDKNTTKIIYSEPSKDVVIFTNVTDGNISGFTIELSVIEPLPKGNGISCRSADIEISDNIIEKNFVGIFCRDASPTIIKNNITGNGTGIQCTGASNPVIGGSLENANDIYGNDNFTILNGTSNTLQATHNYWGTTRIFSGPVDYIPWTDAKHTTELTPPKAPSDLKWAFPTKGVVISSPAIGADGTIYVASQDGKLYAINPNGTQKWAFLTVENTSSSPAIGSDGTIYVGSEDGKLYAINPDGTQKWVFSTNGKLRSSPAISSYGTIYVGSGDYNLYAINPDGTLNWAFPTEDLVWSSPSIDSYGTIYVGSYDNNLYAINPDGRLKWTFLIGDLVWSSPAIGSNGTIYLGSGNYNLYAINPDGTQKWTFITGGVVASPAIGSNGTIYAGSGDYNLYAINPDGTQKWAFMTGSAVDTCPAIGSDGTIYVGSADNILYAINPDGTRKWIFTAKGEVHSSPAIGSDGTIYVGAHDYNLYAIEGNSGGLANSPWPMFHHDLRHTGQAINLPVDPTTGTKH